MAAVDWYIGAGRGSRGMKTSFTYAMLSPAVVCLAWHILDETTRLNCGRRYCVHRHHSDFCCLGSRYGFVHVILRFFKLVLNYIRVQTRFSAFPLLPFGVYCFFTIMVFIFALH